MNEIEIDYLEAELALAAYATLNDLGRLAGPAGNLMSAIQVSNAVDSGDATALAESFVHYSLALMDAYNETFETHLLRGENAAAQHGSWLDSGFQINAEFDKLHVDQPERCAL